MILSKNITPPKHGGDLNDAVKRFGIPIDNWLDMSTGVSPWSYPVNEFDPQVWQSLPPSNASLLEAASQYYQASLSNCIVSPGSQIIIRLLPQCIEKSKVAVPRIGYQEHAWSWGLAGHELCYYDNLDELLTLVTSAKVEHAVLINPNNPSGELASLELIRELLINISGTLVVDEAFIDPFIVTSAEGVHSATTLDSSKLIVLRSVGKFFGLAGIRVGFAIGSNPLLTSLKTLLEPWSISYASQLIAERALLDTQWQYDQGLRIIQADTQFKPVLLELCKVVGSHDIKHSLLFHTVFAEQNSLMKMHDKLAQKGIWTRLFNQGDKPAWLRFSLPSDVNEVIKKAVLDIDI